MSRTKVKSGGHTTVVAEEMNNEDKALSEVRDLASEFHHKLFTISVERGIDYEKVMDAAQEDLEGVNIPEEESEEIRKRATKEGKTFAQVVLEYVRLGLAASPSHLKTFNEYSELTGVPLDEVLNECLSEYPECTIETRLECMAERAAQS
jgi:hypothetical protein